MAKKILLLILFIGISIGFYTLLDMLYAKIFNDNEFNFEIGADVIYPGVVAAAMGMIVIFAGGKDKGSSKSDKNKEKNKD